MVSAVVCVSLRRVWDLCNLPCVYALFKLISIARYAFKSPRICFWGTKYEIYHEHVPHLHSILRRRAGLWLELLASTVCRSLSPISYLFSYYFLWRCHSFTLRKLYIENFALVATTDVQSILEIPATDEIHMEDRNHGLAWTKSSNGIYNTQNSRQDLRVNSFIWIIWCQNDQRRIGFQTKVWSKEVKFTPQNLQLLFFECLSLVFFRFYKPL